MASPLHIAYCTSEMAPFAKTGGLADVSAALPKALVRLGHQVTVFLPRYGSVAFPPGEFLGSGHEPVDALSRSPGFFRPKPAARVNASFVEGPPYSHRPLPSRLGDTDSEA